MLRGRFRDQRFRDLRRNPGGACFHDWQCNPRREPAEPSRPRHRGGGTHGHHQLHLSHAERRQPGPFHRGLSSAGHHSAAGPHRCDPDSTGRRRGAIPAHGGSAFQHRCDQRAGFRPARGRQPRRQRQPGRRDAVCLGIPPACHRRGPGRLQSLPGHCRPHRDSVRGRQLELHANHEPGCVARAQRVHGRQQDDPERHLRQLFGLDRDLQSQPGGELQPVRLLSDRQSPEPHQLDLPGDHHGPTQLSAGVCGRQHGSAGGGTGVARQLQAQQGWGLSRVGGTGRRDHRPGICARFPAAEQ